MKRNRHFVDQYFKNVKKFITVCPGKNRSVFQNLKTDLQHYCEENPTATYEDLVDYFGSPEMFAKSYIDSFPEEQRKGKSRTRRIVIATSILAVVIISTLFVAFFIQEYTSSGDYVEYSAITTYR